MPQMPPTLHKRSKSERDRAYDTERRRVKPWRNLYNTAQWKRIRANQLARQPLCERHLKRGEIVAADTVNHRVRHHGDPVKFFAGPFESACKACHDSEIQREERRPSDI